MNVTISISGVELEVSGNYYKGHDGNYYGDHPYPPEDESFEIDTVGVDGVDITEVLDYLGCDWDTIKGRCIQAVYDKFEQELEDKVVEQHEWKMFEEKQRFEEHAYCGY